MARTASVSRPQHVSAGHQAAGRTSTPAPKPAATLAAAPFRNQHAAWLLDLTQVPTAAGREWRVVHWLKEWVRQRPALKLTADPSGNIVIEPRKHWGRKGSAPIFITAHLDHPAFVVERIIGPGTVELSFRGGVMDEYFPAAKVAVHIGDPLGTPGTPPAQSPVPIARTPQTLMGTITAEGDGIQAPDGSRIFKTYIVEIDDDDAHQSPHADIQIGDVATWHLPPAEIDAQGLVHTHACDDLAALAAAISAYDVLLHQVASTPAGGQAINDVRLLCTRSEEIGFTGAIAACKHKTMPMNARVIALENSRSFSDSPIGGGPIVRVGDRMSVFDPRLTAACAKRAEQIAGHAASPTASQKLADTNQGWKWQRKLMAGGACEATVFFAYGYSATCLCLPLGNYHNMADLQAMQDGSYDAKLSGPPRVAREFIHRDDYNGLIDLLVAIGHDLPAADGALDRIQKLFDKTSFVLGPAANTRQSTPAPKAARAKPAPAKPARTKRTPGKAASKQPRRAPSASKKSPRRS